MPVWHNGGVYLLPKSKSTQETFLYFENMPPPILALKCPFFYGIMETGGRLENIFFFKFDKKLPLFDGPILLIFPLIIYSLSFKVRGV